MGNYDIEPKIELFVLKKNVIVVQISVFEDELWREIVVGQYHDSFGFWQDLATSTVPSSVIKLERR